MKTPLILNNAWVHHLLIFCFSRKFVLGCKSTLGCYIIETATSIASYDASYDASYEGSTRLGTFSQNRSHIKNDFFS